MPSPYFVPTGRLCICNSASSGRPSLPISTPPHVGGPPNIDGGEKQQQPWVDCETNMCRIHSLNFAWPQVPAFGADNELSVILDDSRLH